MAVENIYFDIFSLYLCSFKNLWSSVHYFACVYNIYRWVNTDEGMHKEYLYIFYISEKLPIVFVCCGTLSLSSGV